MASLRLPLQKPHADVHRYRVEAAAMNNTGAAFDSGLVMFIDHLANPLRFAGKVAVVRAVFYASFNQRRTILGVRPDCCNNDTSARGHRSQLLFIKTVGDDRR